MPLSASRWDDRRTDHRTADDEEEFTRVDGETPKLLKALKAR